MDDRKTSADHKKVFITKPFNVRMLRFAYRNTIYAGVYNVSKQKQEAQLQLAIFCRFIER